MSPTNLAFSNLALVLHLNWRIYTYYHDLYMIHESLLLDRRSIDLNGAQEKEGHFHYKNFLRASKRGVTCHTCPIIPKSLYWGLGLNPILSKGIWGWWSRYGMWYLISKLSKSFYNESDLLFLVHHWGRLTSDLRVVGLPTGLPPLAPQDIPNGWMQTFSHVH